MASVPTRLGTERTAVSVSFPIAMSYFIAPFGIWQATDTRVKSWRLFLSDSSSFLLWAEGLTPRMRQGAWLASVSIKAFWKTSGYATQRRRELHSSQHVELLE